MVVLGAKMGCNMLVMMLPRFVLHEKPKSLMIWGLTLGIFAAVSQQPPSTHGFPATGYDGVMETLTLLLKNPDKFKVVAQAAGSNVTLLADQGESKETLSAIENNEMFCAPDSHTAQIIFQRRRNKSKN